MPPGWEPHHTLEAYQREKNERERVKRMEHAGDRPPHREAARYGPLADNAAGDEEFRADRAAAWVSGSETQLLGEQWQRCDAVARRFRAYTDGRAGAGVVLMGYDPTV